MKTALNKAILDSVWPSARKERPITTMTTETKQKSFRERVADATAADTMADDAQQFQREKGAVLFGTITEFRNVTTSWGDTTIMRVKDDAGELTDVWLSGKVLRDWYEEMQPQIGETVGMKCLGQIQSKSSDNTYWAYYVEIDGRPRSKTAQAMANPAQTKIKTDDDEADPFEDE